MTAGSATRATTRLLAAACAAGLLLTAGCDDHSQPPSLAFVAPAPGATVETGTTIRLSLQVTQPGAFTHGIYVVGQSGLGAASVPTKPPYVATLAVPSDARLGEYTLTAIGRPRDAPSPATAATRVVVVTAAGAPVLAGSPRHPLVFEAIGERLPITVPGASSGLDFKSQAPAVATVSPAGIVTALKQGDTTVAVTSGRGDALGSVPVHVLAPALAPSATELAFGDQSSGTTSASKTVTLTNNASYPVSILDVTAGPVFPLDDNCTSSSPLAPGASCTLSVSFAPTSYGAVNGAVRITGSAVIAPTRILLSGNGT